MKRHKDLDITNPKSIQKMITYLEGYKKDFRTQCREFCERLADVGIRVAVFNANSNLADYIFFSKELKNENEYGCEMIMFGRNIGHVFGDGVDAAEISPILMVEYGSGAFAGPPWGVGIDSENSVIVGRGTFPGQKHAFDPNGWWYKDSRTGEFVHSYGFRPTYPMQHAFDMMQTQVDKIAKEVFRLP